MCSLETILMPDFIQNAYYHIDLDKQFESISIEQLKPSPQSIENKLLFSKNSYDLFLNFFDLDKKKNTDQFSILSNALLLPTEQPLEDKIYDMDIDKSIFSISTNPKTWIIEYLSDYQKLIDAYPICYLLYPRIWKILRHIAISNQLYTGETFRISADAAIDEYVELYNEVKYLQNNKEQMKQEILDIFHVPSIHKVKITPMEIAVIYQAYHRNQKLIFNNLNPFMKDIHNHSELSWTDIVNQLPKSLNAVPEFPPCDSITRFLKMNTELLLAKEMTLRICKHCGKFFVTRYSSRAEYCNRLVPNTNSTCQEYSSKKHYKEKQAKNALNQVFTTYYNRIYGRIRRGSLPSDTTLLNDIKALYHSLNTKFIEESNEEKQNEIINQFIVQADLLVQ